MMQNLFIVKIQIRLAFKNVPNHLLQNTITDSVNNFKPLQVVFPAKADGFNQFFFLNKKSLKTIVIMRISNQIMEVQVKNQRIFIMFFRNHFSWLCFFYNFHVFVDGSIFRNQHFFRILIGKTIFVFKSHDISIHGSNDSA